LCGKTDEGKLVIRTGKFGKFISCSRFPECKYTAKIVEKYNDMKCPECKSGDIIIKKSRWGKPFYGCSRYPDCKWASWKKPDEVNTIDSSQKA
jgi:DNA topoisomerase-1